LPTQRTKFGTQDGARGVVAIFRQDEQIGRMALQPCDDRPDPRSAAMTDVQRDYSRNARDGLGCIDIQDSQCG
jgi:hypothetical protein